MARTVKAPTVAVKPPKKPNTTARMSKSQKKATVKPAEPKNNDSVVNQDHGIDKQLSNTDRARNDELRKATRKNKNFQRSQRRKTAKENAARQDKVCNFTRINQSVKTSVPSILKNTKKLVHFADPNEDDFDSNLSKVYKKKKDTKIKGVKEQKVTIKVNNKLYKPKTGEKPTAIHSPVTYGSKLVAKKSTS